MISYDEKKHAPGTLPSPLANGISSPYLAFMTTRKAHPDEFDLIA